MNSRFEDTKLPLPAGEFLFAQFLHSPESPRLLFIPPVIGAAAGLQLMTYRGLANRGCSLFSFEYRGHRRSSGLFSVRNTVADVIHALEWIVGYCQERGLILHCSAMSYGAIPLLAALSQSARRGSLPVRSFTAVSGLFDMGSVLDWRAFLRFYAPAGEVSAEALLRDVVSGTLDFSAPRFWQALRAYLQSLLPDLDIGEGHFGELKYRRAQVVASALEFYTYQPLADFWLPPDLPCCVVYGRNDQLLGLDSPEGRERYLAGVRRLLPQAGIISADIDHFGRGPGRHQLADTVASFLVRSEGAGVAVG